MRSIIVAVLALSVVAGAAGLALAADYSEFPRDFWKQQERNLP